MSKLKNKVAFITGGNSGIGLATAQLFLAQGAKVAITGRRQEAVDQYNQHGNGNTIAFLADAKNADANTNALKATVEKFGKVDILFLNAGIADALPLQVASNDHYQEVLETNLAGPYFTTQSALPFLHDGASIVYNTSIVNVKGFPGFSVYAASKAALRSLVRSLASELAGRSIRVNAVAPGPIETPIYGKMDMSEEQMQGFAEQMTAQIPLGRFGKASEVATAVSFLASSESSFITGAEIPVDGGLAQV